MKKTPKKTASEKTAKEAAPMDTTIREQRVGTAATNNKRACYAIQTLVAEVAALFPETPHVLSGYNGRNTALIVTFDLTEMGGGDSVLFNNLMKILDTDERVASVLTEDYTEAEVAMHARARTQDSREPFGLADAWSILNDGDDFDSDEPAPDWALEGLAGFTTPRDGIQYGGSF